MKDDTYKTIAKISEGLYKEKGSKFLAYAIPVVSEEEIKEHISLLKRILRCATPLLCLHAWSR